MLQMLNQIMDDKLTRENFRVIQSTMSTFIQCLLESPLLMTDRSTIVIDHPLVNGCLAYSKEHYNDPDLSIPLIAQHLGCSPNYLSSLFLEVTGSKLKQYIITMRMDQAKDMLEKSNLNVTETAKACGYENVSYFVQQFKKVHGLTPKKVMLNMIHDEN